MAEVEFGVFSKGIPSADFMLKLENDCERRIGDDKYHFFIPFDIGNFVVYCWAKEKLHPQKRIGDDAPLIRSNEYNTMHQKGLTEFGMAIYENGEIIDPTQDRRFKNFDWVKGIRCWVEKTFFKEELATAIHDIVTIAQQIQ
jgi:hypothetical protein